MRTKPIRLARRGVAEPLEPRRLLSNSGDLFPDREYPGAIGPALAVADVNGDGKPDLITGGGNNTVLVRFGNGDATFGSANAYAAGGTVSAVAIGDVTGDGRPDLVVGLSNTRAVAVLPNLGGGTFGPPVVTALSTSPWIIVPTVTVADVNGDGRPDVVVGGGGYAPPVAYVVPTTAAGTLGVPVAYPLPTPAGSNIYGSFAVSVAVADLNGDGAPDLLFGEGCTGPQGSQNAAANEVTVLFNHGAGTFGSPTTYAAGAGAAAVAVADVNGDGRPDILVADGNGQVMSFPAAGARGLNIVSVLDNAGNGTFAPAVGYGKFSNGICDAQSIAIADANGDGHPDAVVTDLTQDTVDVLLNDGTGGFETPTFIGVGLYPGPVVAVDLNGDGVADLCVLNQSVTNSAGTVTPLPGRGNGTFGQASYAPTATGHWVTVADVTGDGRPDLVDVQSTTSGVGITVMANLGGGTFAVPVTVYTGPGLGAALATDIDGDGLDDLIEPTSSGLTVLLNQGGGTFAAAVTYAGTCTGPVVADVNGDGQRDVVGLGTGGNSVTVFRNAGSGAFAPAASFALPNGTSGTQLQAADLNGDGRADVVVTTSGGVDVLYAQAGGSLAAAVTYAYPGPYQTVAIADVNGDGRPDLVVAGTTNSEVLHADVQLNQGGSFAAAMTYNLGRGYYGTPLLTVADYNNDGQPDLLVSGHLLINGGSGTFTQSTTSGLTIGGANALTDLNGDGIPDVVGVGGPSGGSSFAGALYSQAGRGDGTFAPPVTYDLGFGAGNIAVTDLNGDGKPDVVLVGGPVTYLPQPSDGATLVLINQIPPEPPAVAVAASGQLLVADGSAGGPVTVAQSGGTIAVTTPDSTSTFVAAALSGIRVTGSPVGWTATALTLAGTLTVPVTLLGLGGTDAVTATGTASIAAGPAGGGFNAVTVSSLTVAAGVKLSLATPPAAADRTVLSVGTLSDAGTIDLGGNDMIVTGGTVAAVTALASAGFASGAWTGPGLASTAAAADGRHLSALGVIANVNGSAALYNTFDGVAVTSSAVLVKYTRYGDTNLDGVVTAADYTRVDAGYVAKLTGWANGDVNYDGVVDGSDYSLIDNAFNQQSATAAAVPAAVATGAATARSATMALPATAATPTAWADASWWDRRRAKPSSDFGPAR